MSRLTAGIIQVASFEEGHPGEGGDGMTVAKMVKE